MRRVPTPKRPAEKPNPEPAPRAPAAKPRPPEPLGLGRFRVQFTLDAAAEERLREVRSLLRHQIPDGDLGTIFARALGLLCTEVRKAKFAETPTPRRTPRPPQQASRHIPAGIKRAVAERDLNRCSYRSPGGRRCQSRDFLEFHHLDPWARSRRHSVESITLRCRPHNLHAARKDYGVEKMAQARRVPGHTAPGSRLREL